MKILYSYAGTRKHFKAGVDSRTQFYGLHALRKMGLDVSYKEFTDVYPSFLAKLLPFNVRHMLMYFPARNYDVVFSSALLPMMFLRRIFPSEAKFLLFNISMTRLLTSQKMGSLKKKLIDFSLLTLDGIVCLSQAQSDHLKKHSGFPHKKIFVAPFGIDTDFYKPGDEELPSDSILSVGRDNGRDYKTVFFVAERLPDRTFIVVCSRRNVEGLTVPKNVKVIFDASHQEIRALYRTSRLLLLLTHGSGHADGADCSGQTVLLEAMATGIPSIVTRNSCLEEYITDGEDAFLVTPHDVDDVLEKIGVLDRNDVHDRLSQAARKTIVAKYSENIMAERLLGVFTIVAAS